MRAMLLIDDYRALSPIRCRVPTYESCKLNVFLFAMCYWKKSKIDTEKHQ